MYALLSNSSALLDEAGYALLHRYTEHSLVCFTDDVELRATDGERLDGANISVNGRLVRLPAGEFECGNSSRQLIRFAGPIAREWLDKLAQLQIKFHFYCPPFGLCVEIPFSISQQKLVAELPALVAMSPYVREQCGRGLQRASSNSLQPHDWVDLVCFSEQMREDAANALADIGYDAVAISQYKLRIRGDVDLDAVRKLNGVKVADYARPTELAWGPLRMALGTQENSVGDEPSPMLTGQGQMIAVADTGLDHGVVDDDLHEDFRGRVAALHSWPVNASWNDYVESPALDDGAADRNSGHGTHVAGLALGSGQRSGGKYSGLAPEAQLVFQAIEQYTPVRADRRHDIASGFYLNGRPLDLVELFEQARQDGARIHVNAWGDPAQGQYTDDSYEVDRFLWKYPDAVVMFAAGNSGTDSNGDRALDQRSLYAPATAKNVTAIGATEGPLAGVGYRGTWAGFDPDRRRFSHYATRNDPVSGQPERMAMISSTGPTADGRIKPDICAPGTNLPAPRSRATVSRGWGLASPLPHYMYLGGTSMATGVAGGFAALVRQAWQQHLGEAPSGPALKALLVFGSQPVRRHADGVVESRFSAGFGRLYLPSSLPSPGLTLVDAISQGLATGEHRKYNFTVTASMAFRAVLSWYDYPGERLINDLDLCLIDVDGLRTWGNHPVDGCGSPDRVNTIEMIELANLASGDYTLEVSGANVPTGKQGFALVVNQAVPSIDAYRPDKPRAHSLVLSVEWLKGIGSTYEKRLHGAGIRTLGQLGAQDEATLMLVLKAPAYRIDRIRWRLELLVSTLTQLPESMPDVSLAGALAGDMTSGFTAQQRLALGQLEKVFDKDVLDRVRLTSLLD